MSDSNNPMVKMRYTENNPYIYIEQLRAENERLKTALAEAEKQAEGMKRGWPAKCPIQRLDFFMEIEHPDLGIVPTYGGPFDSYTIPEMDGESTDPWHKRSLFVHRYDHDAGAWVEDETISLRVIQEETIIELEERAEAVESRLRDAEMREATLVEAIEPFRYAIVQRNKEVISGHIRLAHGVQSFFSMSETEKAVKNLRKALSSLPARTSAYHEVIDAAREQARLGAEVSKKLAPYTTACAVTCEAIRKLDGEVK